MSPFLPLIWLTLACAPDALELDPAGSPSSDETAADDAADSADAAADAETGSGDTAGTESAEPEVESVPADPWEPGGALFDESVIHEVALRIEPDAWSSLTYAPDEYAPVTFSFDGVDYAVAIRVKGNSTWRSISDKPSLIVDFNRIVEDQDVDGLPSVYLHNMTYDPSMMHERLAYAYFRAAGTPASRTGYARLTVNGADYGLYLFVEKQNRVYRERWWSDAGGSMYETGSFNHGCDLDDTWPAASPCDCFEVEEEVDGGREALEALCRAAVTSDPEWSSEIEARVDMDAFLAAMAAELTISHYDNYGWNANNWRIYHEPTADRWYWTPWSTDLSFGWYPWSGAPSCGSYGQHPWEYTTGYLMERCAAAPGCKARFREHVEQAIQALEAFDMPARIQEAYALIREDVYSDGRRWYDNAYFEREVACAEVWVAERPDALRDDMAEW